ADRLGAARTLAVVSFGSAVSWAVLASTTSYPALMMAMLLCGACGAAVFPPTNILLTQVFGLAALPQTLGLLSALTLPITFVMSPAAGAAHDALGKYAGISASLAGACGVIGLVFLFIRRRVDGARTSRAHVAEPQ